MIIELNLIQNFLLALFVVLSLGVVIFAAKKLFGSKSPSGKNAVLSEKTDKLPESPRADTINTHQLEKERVKEEESENYEKLLRVGRRHAKSLLYETAREAGRILKGTRQTNEHVEEHLDKVLHNIAANDIHTLKTATSSFDQDFQKNLAAIQTQMQETMHAMMEETKKRYDQKLEEFMQELMKKGAASQSETDKKTAEMLAKAEAEIAEYKKAKLSQADEEVTKLVQKVYKDILRISMPENVHEELIVKSLEQAKKDGILKL